MLIHSHRGPLTADLHRFHGLRLAKIRQSGYSVEEIADFVAHLPPDSALTRALDPEWFLTNDTYLLRAIEHGVRVLAWQQTKDAARRLPEDYPVQRPITAAEAEEQKPEREKYDAVPIDEMRDFLGWSA